MDCTYANHYSFQCNIPCCALLISHVKSKIGCLEITTNSDKLALPRNADVQIIHSVCFVKKTGRSCFFVLLHFVSCHCVLCWILHRFEYFSFRHLAGYGSFPTWTRPDAHGGKLPFLAFLFLLLEREPEPKCCNQSKTSDLFPVVLRKEPIAFHS